MEIDFFFYKNSEPFQVEQKISILQENFDCAKIVRDNEGKTLQK